MGNNGHGTALLLVAAFTAVGCSKPFEETKTTAQQQSPVSAPAKPVAATNAIDPEDEEGTGGTVPIRNAGPVSFADGDDLAVADHRGRLRRVAGSGHRGERDGLGPDLARRRRRGDLRGVLG